MTILRKIIEIDEEKCDGCGVCVPSCAEGAIQVIDGKAKLIAEKYCDGLGACLGECPKDALNIIEREVEEFDEEAVEKHLKATESEAKAAEPAGHQGCPSARLQHFAGDGSSGKAGEASALSGAPSALSTWPVQIKLVPPTAPYLKGADLLVAADCTSFACAGFHQDFLKGKVLMIGCPKLDDVEPYVQKFADIFSTADIKSVTVVVMEVPCCQGLPVVVEKGMELAGKTVPMEKVVVSVRGEVKE